MYDIRTIGVIGAGQMGRGIAQVAAQSGFKTMVFDASTENLEHGIEFIKNQLERGLSKGKWDQSHMDDALAKLSKVENVHDFKECDLIIEAATENKDIKFEIFKQIDEVAKDSAILATNTSSISITEIAAVTRRPDKVVGMHFMNPVPVMKLVEGIRGLETEEAVFDAVDAVAVKMGKLCQGQRRGWIRCQ